MNLRLIFLKNISENLAETMPFDKEMDDAAKKIQVHYRNKKKPKHIKSEPKIMKNIENEKKTGFRIKFQNSLNLNDFL